MPFKDRHKFGILDDVKSGKGLLGKIFGPGAKRGPGGAAPATDRVRPDHHAALEQAGFKHVATVGNRVHYKHPDGRSVVHSNDTTHLSYPGGAQGVGYSSGQALASGLAKPHRKARPDLGGAIRGVGKYGKGLVDKTLDRNISQSSAGFSAKFEAWPGCPRCKSSNVGGMGPNTPGGSICHNCGHGFNGYNPKKVDPTFCDHCNEGRPHPKKQDQMSANTESSGNVTPGPTEQRAGGKWITGSEQPSAPNRHAARFNGDESLHDVPPALKKALERHGYRPNGRTSRAWGTEYRYAHPDGHEVVHTGSWLGQPRGGGNTRIRYSSGGGWVGREEEYHNPANAVVSLDRYHGKQSGAGGKFWSGGVRDMYVVRGSGINGKTVHTEGPYGRGEHPHPAGLISNHYDLGAAHRAAARYAKKWGYKHLPHKTPPGRQGPANAQFMGAPVAAGGSMTPGLRSPGSGEKPPKPAAPAKLGVGGRGDEPSTHDKLHRAIHSMAGLLQGRGHHKEAGDLRSAADLHHRRGDFAMLQKTLESANAAVAGKVPPIGPQGDHSAKLAESPPKKRRTSAQAQYSKDRKRIALERKWAERGMPKHVRAKYTGPWGYVGPQ